VVVYSSCEQVELFLNGKSVRKKTTNRSNEFTAKYQVPYAKGELKVVGYKGKKIVSTAILQSAEKATALKLSTDAAQLTANNQDLAYVTVELVDANGKRNPKADNLVKFSIDGPGEIIAVGNANPTSLESYQLPQRKAWQGKCLVIIKTTEKAGSITLRATADGMQGAILTVTSNKP
jgi:beta-galactosidase